jgi:hypothetical protein
MRVGRIVTLVVATAGTAWVGLSAAPRAETTRTVYIAAQDSKGVPITDLKAGELTVKEDGKDRAIADLKPATADYDVTILVDDTGSGAFQSGVLALLQAVVEHAKVTIEQFTPQAVKILDNTNEFEKVQAALNKLGPRGKIDHQGLQLNEAIVEASRSIAQRKPARPAIVVFTIAGVGTVDNPNFAMDQLRDSGAPLHVVYVSNSDVGVVIGDGPRQSGGVLVQAQNVNALPAAYKRVIDAMTNQYVLTYTLPDGVKPAERLQVSTSRKGITLLAPQRIPPK